MQLFVIDTNGAEERYEIYDHIESFNLDSGGRLRPVASGPALQVEDTGGNVFLTDLGCKERVRLADWELPPELRWAWQANQELRIGPYILLWRPAQTRWMQWRSGWTRNRIFLWLTALVIAGLAIGLVWLGLSLRFRQKNTVRIAAAPGVWMTQYFSAFPTPPTVTPTATPTAPTATPTLTPTVITTVTPADLRPTNTPTPTATLSLTETMKLMGAGSAVNGTPVIDAHHLKPPKEDWDGRLDLLGVKYIPAITPIGGKFWRLIGAKWLDEQESTGMHHIFVEVLDENKERVLEPVTMTMTWTTGVCKRFMENTPPLSIGTVQFRPYGMNCPMYNAGYVYSVKISGFGLPSDSVESLGLGSIEQRTWNIRTSFLLIFQRTTRVE